MARFNKRREVALATPRPNKRREMLRQLWAPSNDLPVLSGFDHDKIYRVKLTQSVTPAGHSFPLRPTQDVLVSGEIAEEIKEFIAGAVKVD
jgi:hypothetical protein